MRGIVYTDDARFSGHLVDIAPEINGRLIDVAVHEGTFVKKGPRSSGWIRPYRRRR